MHPSQPSPNDSDALHRIRHSLAHVLAQAVLTIRPGSKLGFGPAIDDGFYYDFILSAPITDADFPKLEQRMRQIIREDQEFVREDLEHDSAVQRLDEMGEPYKKEYAEELFAKRGIETLSFYRNGPFLDMCEGPHVSSTARIPEDCFRIRSVAGAYWRGNVDNPMMTRIYAWAFPSKSELEAHVKAWEEAQARDHKKLGRQLDIYVIDDTIGAGLPLWLPNGTVLRDELEKLARELEFKAGYQRVATPHLAKAALYRQTGHLPYYKKHMYPFMELKEESASGEAGDAVQESYVLKPMNCPHHHRIFAARPRSYRDLPLRLAEYGQVYRFEDSGALSGLLRVRGMCMNDAHIYCTEQQLHSEFMAVMEMHRQVYEILGITGYYMRLSTWDPDDPKGKSKYVDDPAAWEASQTLIRRAMTDSGLPFVVVAGEAAFYGPKIDVQLTTVTGREETVSTNQIDFAVPARLDLEYVTPEGSRARPYVIHRAPLGTHERFVAFLLERYGGAFPPWLAPVQVRLLTIVDAVLPYAEKLVADLRDDFVRAEVDTSGERIAKKIKNALEAKVPNILVVGEREAAAGQVTLRRYGVEQQATVPYADFKARVLDAIRTRSESMTL